MAGHFMIYSDKNVLVLIKEQQKFFENNMVYKPTSYHYALHSLKLQILRFGVDSVLVSHTTLKNEMKLRVELSYVKDYDTLSIELDYATNKDYAFMSPRVKSLTMEGYKYDQYSDSSCGVDKLVCNIKNIPLIEGNPYWSELIQIMIALYNYNETKLEFESTKYDMTI